MLPDSITSLIRDEQARVGGRFIEGVDLETYITKLGDKAEIVSDIVPGRCRGFVAFYCNDLTTRRAYITLVLVHPDDRGSGVGRALVDAVLALAKSRGFVACALEVSKTNEAAYGLYTDRGFRPVGDRGGKQLLEIDL
jgi:ribosomal-protein-alanine N-acetyltransferase